MTPDITHELTKHYRQFDYEIDGDRLLVYANDPLIAPHTLQDMLGAALWFAGKLDAVPKANVPLV